MLELIELTHQQNLYQMTTHLLFHTYTPQQIYCKEESKCLAVANTKIKDGHFLQR